MSVTVGSASRDLELDAGLDVLNSGYLRIYSGTVPANADAALGGATLLAELRFAATAFGASSGGTKTAATITSGTAVASGTPSFFRALKSDGTTVVLQGSVGATGDIVVSGSITAGDTVSASSLAVSAS